MMEILQVAVSKLKIKFSELVDAIYSFKNYGIKSCNNNISKSYNSVKLELIFLMNVEYVCLTDEQLFKIQNNSFKCLFKKESFPELSTKMSLI
jgi:hypothetical protein